MIMGIENKGTKQMPTSGSYSYGNATGKPASQGSIKYGEDLRAGNSNKKGK